MQGVATFMGLYLFTWVIATAGVSLTDVDFATATSAVATAMGGVGPGLGKIGPIDNFLWMHPSRRPSSASACWPDASRSSRSC